MKLYEFIEKHEGRVDHVYTCPAGYKTIGVGWNIDSNKLPNHIYDYLKNNGKISDNMIDELLEISVNIAKKDCIKLFPKFENFSENRQIALIDFLFNLGIARAKNFKKAVSAINSDNWKDAALQLESSLWYKQVKNRAREVVNLIKNG